MALVSAAEVFQFAVKIEQNGYDFYTKYAEKLDSSSEKEIFQYLADEESKHIKTFSRMLDSVESFKQPLNYPDEYFTYLQAYADNLIFKPGDLDAELAQIKDTKSAIDFGIKRELDSILYYQEIKSFVTKAEKDHIDTIISEERKHFTKLSQMKKRIR